MVRVSIKLIYAATDLLDAHPTLQISPSVKYELPPNISQRRLQPQFRILLMQPDHMRGHRLTLRLPLALEEQTLEAELRNSLLGLDLRRNLKQSIRFPHVLLAGRISAPHDNPLRRLFYHFEVICDQRAHVVCRGA